MKKTFFFAVLVSLFFSCTKDNNIQQSSSPVLIPTLPRNPNLNLSLCINSYSALVSQLGSSTVNISSVVFEDNSMVNVGTNGIALITYNAINTPEDNSIFRSVINIYYNIYGYSQNYNQNTWSLGCGFISTNNYTNLKVNTSKTLIINTSFTWGIPTPTGKTGLRIKYLVL